VQHAFSSDNIPTLHLAIPALESLHKAWSSRAECPKYELFTPALQSACDKIDQYYEKTTESSAYIMSMSAPCFFPFLSFIDDMAPVLNPSEKMAYFKKNWSVELQNDITICAEDVV
jgi:hypothetical protein